MRLFWNRLICRFLDHDFQALHRCSFWAGQVYCERCERMFGYHADVGSLLPWTDDLCHCGALEKH